MKTLIKASTDRTPYVKLDGEHKTVEFSGMSYPENATKFYKPVFEWLDEFYKEEMQSNVKQPHLRCDFKFEFLSSSSFIILRDIIDRLVDIKNENDGELQINWHYPEHDIDTLSIAKELEEFYEELTFNFFHLEH